MKLENLFQLIKVSSTQFRINYSDGDGRLFWQPLKKLLMKVDIRAEQWQEVNSTIADKIYVLSEYDQNGFVEANHFLRQHIRIVREEEPTLRRVMQIALNAGQFAAVADRQQVVTWAEYEQNNLGYIETYLSDRDISSMGDALPDYLIQSTRHYLQEQCKIDRNCV